MIARLLALLAAKAPKKTCSICYAEYDGPHCPNCGYF